MPVKISHESPLELLDFSRSYNDFDYALVHLFDVYPQYLDFFKKSLRQGRTVYLDNSFFELGHAYNEKKYVEYINELGEINSENFYYVLPDSENLAETRDFILNNNLRGKRIGVVHGESESEIASRIRELGTFCDIVAIPYKLGKITRSELILGFLEPCHVLDNLKIHILGCVNPLEFSYYNSRNWFYSLDTSSPVLHGLEGIRYSKNGLAEKSKTLMANLMEINITPKMLEDVKYNVKMFKEILNV